MLKKKFTPEEDSKILNLVKKNGARNWDIIAKDIPGRTGRQCRDRYHNYLFPGYFNGQWTREEDELLYMKICQFGNQWSKIKQFFPGRTANSIRNRWNCFVCRIQFNGNYAQKNAFDNKDSKVESEIQIDESYITSDERKKDDDFLTDALRIYSIPNLLVHPDDSINQILRVNEATQTIESSLLCF